MFCFPDIDVLSTQPKGSLSHSRGLSNAKDSGVNLYPVGTVIIQCNLADKTGSILISISYSDHKIGSLCYQGILKVFMSLLEYRN